MRRGWNPTRLALVVLAVLAWAYAVWFFLDQSGWWDAAWLDVTVYRQGAAAWLAGEDVYTGGYGFKRDLPFTYPPFAFVVFVPIWLAGHQVAVVGTFILNAVLLCLCVRWGAQYALPGRSIGWAVPAIVAAGCAVWVEPVRTTIGFGQINVVLLALVLGLDARSTGWAGVGAGIGAAIKITPALLVAAQLVRGNLKAFARGVAAFLACTLVGAVLAWNDTVTFYGRLLWQSDRPGGLAYDGNQSLRAVIARLEIGPAVPVWLLLVAATLALGAYAVRRHRGDAWASLTAAGVASLLISPISWNHHWVWVLPIVAVGLRYRKSGWLLGASVLLALATVILTSPAAFLKASWLFSIWPFGAVNAYVLIGVVWLVALALTPTTQPARQPEPATA